MNSLPSGKLKNFILPFGFFKITLKNFNNLRIELRFFSYILCHLKKLKNFVKLLRLRFKVLFKIFAKCIFCSKFHLGAQKFCELLKNATQLEFVQEPEKHNKLFTQTVPSPGYKLPQKKMSFKNQLKIMQFAKNLDFYRLILIFNLHKL